MKQIIGFLLMFAMVATAHSQELYVFSQPASNVPAKSITVKASGRFVNKSAGDGFRQRYLPEVIVGLNKNWMFSVGSSFSDFYFNNIRYDGARFYTKYRFLSNDGVHRHFRMAAFADAGYTRNPYRYQEVNLEGDNDGAQVGLVATQLVNKTAVSLTAAYTRVFAAKAAHRDHLGHSLHMLNYSLSSGQLLLPKEYTDYRQTNLNLYFEVLGMKGIDNAHYLLGFAPALQVIFNSNTKVNLGYRFQVAGNMTRVGNNVIQLSLERTLLNAWK